MLHILISVHLPTDLLSYLTLVLKRRLKSLFDGCARCRTGYLGQRILARQMMLEERIYQDSECNEG